jgi:hypothetical protein
MMRDARLRPLSRDHHHALVLARFIGSICAHDGMDAEAVAVVKERFAAEIAPHFLIEEVLLSALEGCGVDDLVKRTRDEHAAILQLLDATSASPKSCMCELGKLLTDHVRFEERELYPACEEKLSADALERIAAAHARGE